MDKLQQIILERPAFHRGETEIERAFDAKESLLPPQEAAALSSTELTCHGIDGEVLAFIADNVDPGQRTLETGAGLSTLVFALRGTEHIAITPAASEIELITRYALEREISLSTVRFVREPSERYLPACTAEELDVVLLDGKHAFPWPIIDWFHTADRLREGGILLVDDVALRSVAILVEFLIADPAWQLVRRFSDQTLAFRKVCDSAHDVAWHMQPFNFPQR